MPSSELESHLLWLEGRPGGRPSPRLLDIEFLHLPDYGRNRPWRHTGWRGADLPDNYPFDTTPEGLFDAVDPGERIEGIRIHESIPGGTYRDKDFDGAGAPRWEPTPSSHPSGQIESGGRLPSEDTGSIGQYFERMRGSINLSARDKSFLREWMDDFLAHGSIADSEAIGNRIRSYREAIDTLGELLRNDNGAKDPIRAAFLRMKAEAIEKRILQQLRYRLKPGSRASGSTVRDWYRPLDGGTTAPLDEALVHRNPRRPGDPDASAHRVCWMPSAGPWFDPDAYDAAFRKAGLSAPDFYILNDGWTVMIQKAVALWEPGHVHRFELKPGIPFHVGTGYVHFADPDTPAHAWLCHKPGHTPVFYTTFENNNFFIELILRRRLHITHILHTTEGVGLGGCGASVTPLFNLLGHTPVHSMLSNRDFILGGREYMNFEILEWTGVDPAMLKGFRMLPSGRSVLQPGQEHPCPPTLHGFRIAHTRDNLPGIPYSPDYR